MSMTLSSAPLRALKFGDDAPNGAVNARKIDKKNGIAELAANIQAVGLIQPPIAVRIDGEFYLVAGNRRLAALQQLARQKDSGITPDTNVPIIVRGDLPVSAREVSMAADVFNVPHHPVDRFATFQYMAEQGVSIDDIAARYGMKKAAVAQALRLAGLSPKIREAWRRGEITGDTAEAFLTAGSGTDSIERQEKAFAELSRSKNLYRRSVLNYFKAEDSLVESMLALVGEDEYRKHGGEVTSNLFAEQRGVTDPALLRKLAGDKIADRCKKLVEAGWKWAEPGTAFPQGTWSLGRIYKTGKTWTDEQKAAAGCVVNISRTGKLEVEEGFIRKGDKPPRKSGGAKEAAADSPARPARKPTELSQALTRRLADTLVTATQAALGEHQRAMRDPVALALNATVRKLIGEPGYPHMPNTLRDDLPVIRDALPAETFNTALRKAFDAEDYFKGAGKTLREKALLDMGLDKSAVASAKTELCVAEAKRTGWLPPQLRTSHYIGPQKARPVKQAGRKKGTHK